MPSGCYRSTERSVTPWQSKDIKKAALIRALLFLIADAKLFSLASDGCCNTNACFNKNVGFSEQYKMLVAIGVDNGENVIVFLFAISSNADVTVFFNSGTTFDEFCKISGFFSYCCDGFKFSGVVFNDIKLAVF